LNITSSDTNINGVNIATQKKKNSISDSMINIYDASGLIGENNNLFNNSTVCTNINDINKNISELDEENTPDEVNIKIKIVEESVDLYPLSLQT
jgi:ABC-type transporter Mla maintaining outer membrane lipid asymmetry ATPase subunit MlaF